MEGLGGQLSGTISYITDPYILMIPGLRGHQKASGNPVYSTAGKLLPPEQSCSLRLQQTFNFLDLSDQKYLSVYENET